MTSPDENAATEKNNKESLEMDKQFQKKESPQDSMCSLFHHVVLYAVQRTDKNSPIN